jgi:hypothetical protein
MATTAGDKASPSVDTMVDKLGNKIWRTDTSKAGEMTPEMVSKLVQDVTDSDVSSTVTLVNKIVSTAQDRMEFSIFDFVGFDPLMIVRVLKAYQKHYSEGNEDLMSDVRFSIAATIYMGNLQTKALTRRALEGRTKIEYLTRKYNVRTGSQGAGLPAEALTFPRIAASFPVLAIRMATTLPPKAVDIAFKGKLVPACMRLTPFGSLCSPNMDDTLRLFLMEASNAHGADMALAYERGRCKKAKTEFKPNPKEAAEDQWAFMEVAGDSSVPEEDMKKTILTELNLGQFHANLAEVVANYRSKVQGKEVGVSDVMGKGAFEKALSEYIASASPSTTSE